MFTSFLWHSISDHTISKSKKQNKYDLTFFLLFESFEEKKTVIFLAIGTSAIPNLQSDRKRTPRHVSKLSNVERHFSIKPSSEWKIHQRKCLCDVLNNKMSQENESAYGDEGENKQLKRVMWEIYSICGFGLCTTNYDDKIESQTQRYCCLFISSFFRSLVVVVAFSSLFPQNLLWAEFILHLNYLISLRILVVNKNGIEMLAMVMVMVMMMYFIRTHKMR